MLYSNEGWIQCISYLHAECGADKVVDGGHLVAVKVDGNQQQHATERRPHSTHSKHHQILQLSKTGPAGS